MFNTRKIAFYWYKWARILIEDKIKKLFLDVSKIKISFKFMLQKNVGEPIYH